MTEDEILKMHAEQGEVPCERCKVFCDRDADSEFTLCGGCDEYYEEYVIIRELKAELKALRDKYEPKG